MNRRLAEFLTRLYPPVWRARYGAEYRMFLEARRVSVAEILNVISHAVIEHVCEDWRYGPNLIVLQFSVGGGLYLAGGRHEAVMAQHPALATGWLAMEAGAAAVLLSALSLSIFVPLALDVIPKRVGWIISLAAAVWAFLEYLPWRGDFGSWAGPIAVFAAIAGAVGIGSAGMYSRVVLGRLWDLEPEDLECLCPSMRYCLRKTRDWGPAKLEALRLSVMILSSTIFAVQTRRADHLVSTWGMLAVSLAIYWDDVFHPTKHRGRIR